MEKKPISVIFVIVIFISFVATGIFAYLYLTERDISADLEANLQVQTTTFNEQIRLLEIGEDPTMFEREGWRISFEMGEDWEDIGADNSIGMSYYFKEEPEDLETLILYLSEDKDTEHPHLFIRKAGNPDFMTFDLFSEAYLNESMQPIVDLQREIHTGLHRMEGDTQYYPTTYFLEAGDEMYIIENPPHPSDMTATEAEREVRMVHDGTEIKAIRAIFRTLAISN